mmetsp:Transcript_18658/g.57368  ORF Transcript_18658/g.57368 Transcript_18658/m.57368 type:complete len:918 (-) Transcript_18658:166-2919(-)
MPFDDDAEASDAAESWCFTGGRDGGGGGAGGGDKKSSKTQASSSSRSTTSPSSSASSSDSKTKKPPSSDSSEEEGVPWTGHRFSVVVPYHPAQTTQLLRLAITLRDHLKVEDLDEFYAVSPCLTRASVVAAATCTKLQDQDPAALHFAPPLSKLAKAKYRIDQAWPKEGCHHSLFDFLPTQKWRHYCEDFVVCGRLPCDFVHRPHGWHIQQLVKLGISRLITKTPHVLFLDSDALAVGTISSSTIINQDTGASKMLNENCNIHDYRWLNEWEFWKAEYRVALHLLGNVSYTADYLPPEDACVFRHSPLVVSTALLQKLVKAIEDKTPELFNKRRLRELSAGDDSSHGSSASESTMSGGTVSPWYAELALLKFTDLSLYDSFRLLHWNTAFGNVVLGKGIHDADGVVRTLDLVTPKGMPLIEKITDDKKRRDIMRRHAQYVLEHWRGHGLLEKAMFFNCRGYETQLSNKECFQVAKAIAENKRNSGNTHDLDADIAELKRNVRDSTPAALKCPAKLGVALNTGDHAHALSRVRFAVSNEGWLGNPSATQSLGWKKGQKPHVVVYSNLQTECIPLGGPFTDETALKKIPKHKNNRKTSNSTTNMPAPDVCVEMKPCCGGRDLGKTLADAQYMREHTWKRMLDDFPKDTYWFLSTEDDVWWDLEGLCDIATDMIADFGVPSSTPVLIGGGAPPTSAVFGGLILMNRPLLELYGNHTLLDMCREDLIRNGNEQFRAYTYAGAKYNNDHFISHCSFEYFPKILGSYVARRVFFPIFHEGAPRPKYFYHNGASWVTSKRARDFILHLQADEPIVAFHHATIGDMAFLQKQVQMPPMRTRRRLESLEDAALSSSSSADFAAAAPPPPEESSSSSSASPLLRDLSPEDDADDDDAAAADRPESRRRLSTRSRWMVDHSPAVFDAV